MNDYIEPDYVDPILKKLITVLEAEGPSELIGRYRYGDLLVVGKDELPLVAVAKGRTQIFPASNMEDEHLMSVVISVIYDMTNDITQSEEFVAGTSGLYDLVERRTDDYQLHEQSIAYVLRKYQTLDDHMWLAVGPGQEVSIEYGLGVNRRGPGAFSVEAAIRFTVKLHKTRVSQLNP